MASSKKTAITNVRVFDGFKLSESTTVVIEGDRIISDVSNAFEIDGHGCTLLPGLIDAHVHVFHRDELHQMARAGITTALDSEYSTEDNVAHIHLLTMHNVISGIFPSRNGGLVPQATRSARLLQRWRTSNFRG